MGRFLSSLALLAVGAASSQLMPEKGHHHHLQSDHDHLQHEHQHRARAGARRHHPVVPSNPRWPGASTPTSANCTVQWFNQSVDHLGSTTDATFMQRYFTYDAFWKPGGPIWVYTGNEADVTLYVNAVRLRGFDATSQPTRPAIAPSHPSAVVLSPRTIAYTTARPDWPDVGERRGVNAEEFGAYLLFAEHRFYGESLPFGDSQDLRDMQYLSTEQALADFSYLIRDFKQRMDAANSAVVAFGGSYGGMLASWWRLKVRTRGHGAYTHARTCTHAHARTRTTLALALALALKFPWAVDGAIAASAPIWSFEGEEPAYDPGSYAKIVTRDASSAGGASDACAANIEKSWDSIFDSGTSAEGRAWLASQLSLCEPPVDNNDVWTLAYWLQSAFDYMSMVSSAEPLLSDPCRAHLLYCGSRLDSHRSFPAPLPLPSS